MKDNIVELVLPLLTIAMKLVFQVVALIKLVAFQVRDRSKPSSLIINPAPYILSVVQWPHEFTFTMTKSLSESPNVPSAIFVLLSAFAMWHIGLPLSFVLYSVRPLLDP